MPEFFWSQEEFWVFFSLDHCIINSQHRLLHLTWAYILFPLSITEKSRQLLRTCRSGSDLCLQEQMQPQNTLGLASDLEITLH